MVDVCLSHSQKLVKLKNKLQFIESTDVLLKISDIQIQ